MNQNILGWLLDGPDWLKYAVELHLLDKNPDPGLALKDPAIVSLRERLSNRQLGLPALLEKKIYYTHAGNAYWYLYFLADIGLTARDLGIQAELEQLLARQSPSGDFITEPGTMPNYYCISAILLSTIAWLGFKEYPAVRKYLKVVLDTQRYDGGWHCEKSRSGGESYDPESCPMDNLNILMLVGQYDDLRNSDRFNGAIDLLLYHWKQRDRKLRLDGFGVGSRYSALKYPAVDYGILRVLDAVSVFPHAIKRPVFSEMLDWVRKKAIDGKYTPEAASGSFPGFDFDQMEQPSRWLTFLISRIEKRMGLTA
ncbi:MAG: hypothetical protein AB1597_05265 [Chloroflexota bacterium]